MGIIFRYLTQKKVKIFSMAHVIFYGSFIGLLIFPAEGFNLPGQLGRPAEQRIPNTCQTLSGTSCLYKQPLHWQLHNLNNNHNNSLNYNNNNNHNNLNKWQHQLCDNKWSSCRSDMCLPLHMEWSHPQHVC